MRGETKVTGSEQRRRTASPSGSIRPAAAGKIKGTITAPISISALAKPLTA